MASAFSLDLITIRLSGEVLCNSNGTSTLGTSIQSYEYSAYGQVAASDPNFTANPYMFTGRRFDYETGLYYYRARYYNPYIGRFLQTDPMGYGDGINRYAYCKNNPLKYVDPSGQVSEIYTPPAVAIVVADYGISVGVSIYGTATILQYIFDTQGQEIVVEGKTTIFLPDYDPNDPNTLEYGPKTQSFDDIMDDPNLWELWAWKKNYPQDRPYNVYEALRIYQNLEKYYGEPPIIHPPHGGHEWHMKPPHRRKKHIPITKEAFDYLKKKFGL